MLFVLLLVKVVQFCFKKRRLGYQKFHKMVTDILIATGPRSFLVGIKS